MIVYQTVWQAVRNSLRLPDMSIITVHGGNPEDNSRSNSTDTGPFIHCVLLLGADSPGINPGGKGSRRPQGYGKNIGMRKHTRLLKS